MTNDNLRFPGAAPGSVLERIPFAERTFPAVLRRAAREFGERTFIADGAWSLSYSGMLAQVSQAAGALRALGVEHGTVVVLMLNNRIEYTVLWWAITSLGAIAALIHPDARGDYLRHMLEVADARVLLVDADLLEGSRPDLLAVGMLDRVLAMDAKSGNRHAGDGIGRWEDTLAGATRIELPEVSPSDPSTIMYTSGTTGRSKGVLRSHHYDFMYAAMAVDGQRVEQDAVFWSSSAMSHARTASCQLFASMLTGAKVVLAQRFSLSRFWSDMQSSGATHIHLSASMLNMIARAPRCPEDRSHSLTRSSASRRGRKIPPRWRQGTDSE